MKKIYLIILGLLLLPGCIQPSALLGPSITVATSGNLYKAGLSYGSNTIIKQSTGKTTTEHAIYYLENRKNKNKKEKLNELVESHILSTRAEYFK